MKQITLYLLVLITTVTACDDAKKKNKSNNKEETKESAAEYGLQNFAVVWTWATDDVEKVSKFSPKISEELIAFWKEGKVENVYYNTDAKEDKLAHFPNIVFFVKAKDYQAAKKNLNKLIVVKNNIATYQLFPVGNLWLNRKVEAIKKRGITNSFVSIWKSTDKNPDQKTIQSQNDTILSLWNSGAIENVYFDISPKHKENKKTDFVFFINTNTEEDAKVLCESLPFSKKDYATYKIHRVGVHWLGIVE